MQLSISVTFLLLFAPLVSSITLPRPYDPYLDDPAFREMVDYYDSHPSGTYTDDPSIPPIDVPLDIDVSLDADAPLNTTAPSLHRRWQESASPLVCQTSKASAPIHEIHLAANILIADHDPQDRCTVDNRFGSKCTKFREVGYASLSMCGAYKRAIKCHTLAWAAKHIAESCKKDGVAGGTYRFVAANNLIVSVH